MIRTFLGRPAGAGEWALSSFVLLVLSVGALVAAFILPGDYLQLVAIAAHGLLWWQVLRGVWALCRDEGRNDWLLAGAVLWWLGLTGLQLLGLLCWSSPPEAASETPWLQF